MAAFVLVLQVLLFGTMLKDGSFVENENQSSLNNFLVIIYEQM